MRVLWSGSIALPDSARLPDISIHIPDGNATLPWPEDASIDLLSVVATGHIPLHIVIGARCLVSTNDIESQRWFENALFSGKLVDQRDGQEQAWWRSARFDSPLGVLLRVHARSDVSNGSKPRVTELLLIASRYASSASERPLTPPRSSPSPDGGTGNPSDVPCFCIYAIPLSADLVDTHSNNTVTPPASPGRDDERIEGAFIPSIQKSIEDSEIINHPPVRKRKSVTDALDAATDRLRKARRKGGESVSAAAAYGLKRDNSMPLLKHRRSVSSTQYPLQTRPLSRASSATSAQLVGTREQSLTALAKRSSLSEVQRVPDNSDSAAADVQSRNKDTISKMVMAGMRLHGLSQSKSRRGHSNKGAAPSDLPAVVEDSDCQRRKEEEFKLIYHQVFKGACFAFRQHISVANLNPHAGSVQEAVDKLLGLYLTDPLITDVSGNDEEFTPGGRKAFGVNTPEH